MKFKELELSNRSKGWKRFEKSRHNYRTFAYVILGALAGFIIFYFSEGRHMNKITSGDLINSLLLGGLFGFFITNSPCARGRC